ncbi:MAG: hypothetical protein IPF49_03375 [Gammaproteobacteria bacterium]|nr:hypothetical protein [Gammaproteobacteria bacterium]
MGSFIADGAGLAGFDASPVTERSDTVLHALRTSAFLAATLTRRPEFIVGHIPIYLRECNFDRLKKIFAVQRLECDILGKRSSSFISWMSDSALGKQGQAPL